MFKWQICLHTTFMANFFQHCIHYVNNEIPFILYLPLTIYFKYFVKGEYITSVEYEGFLVPLYP